MSGKIVNCYKYISFRCPECEKINTARLSVFDVKKKSVTNINCSCGESSVSIRRKKDGYEFVMPCCLCGERHVYNVGYFTMVRGRLHGFECPEFEFGYSAIGDEEKIERWCIHELPGVERFIYQLNEYFKNDDSFMEASIEKLRQLEMDNMIYCDCGSRNIKINLFEDKITAICMDCNANGMIKFENADDFKKFCEMKSIKLMSYKTIAKKLNIKMVDKKQ